MVRYKVKPEQVPENEALARAVYAELERAQPAGVRYATYKLADRLSFVHLVSIETDDGESPLRGLASFREFQRGLSGRCAELPVPTELDEIGSFGWRSPESERT